MKKIETNQPNVTEQEVENEKIKDAQWYVLNCYKGHEDKVCADLKKRIENKANLKNSIFDIRIIKETISAGKDKKPEEKNKFAGYIFVQMIMNDATWYDVRNTPGVTGFIGSSGKGIKPNPLSSKEVNEMLYRNTKAYITPKAKKEKEFTRDFEKDDYIHIISGALKDHEGKIVHLDDDKGVAEIMINFFGRQTPIKVEYNICKKVNT